MEELNQKRRDCVADFLAVRERMLQSVSQSNTTSPASNTEASQKKTLEDIVEDLAAFTFEFDSSDDDAAATAVGRMAQFDEALVSSVAQKFKEEQPSPLLSYKLNGSSDDIALSLCDSAVVEVQLVLDRPVNRHVLSALLRLNFAPNSEKLRSCRFSTLKDSLRHGLFVDQLVGQVSHPSVVSLDAHHRDRREVGKNDKSRDGDDNSGPGMNI